MIFIFAGKAHPADQQGIDIIKEIIKYTLDERFIGKVYFMEDYSLALSRLLVRGCDVWLNTPNRPNEASGTSGMKLSVNGGVNLSISDGWWCEGYNKENGWTIGPIVSSLDSIKEHSGYADAESLYRTLEESVIPLYYNRDANNLPNGWLDVSRNAMRTLTPSFSSHRMVSDYMQDYYIPTATRKNSLYKNDFILAKNVSEWKHKVAHTFPSVCIDEVIFEGVGNNILYVGQKVRILVYIKPGELEVENLKVELVMGYSDAHNDAHDFIEKPKILPLEFKERLENGKVSYGGEFTVQGNGHHSYGVRAIPYHADLVSPFDTRLVLWA